VQRILLFSAPILVMPAAAVGQDSVLVPGQTVRVTAHTYDLRRTAVTLVGSQSDSIQLQHTRKRLERGSAVTDSVRQAVPLAAVTKLEAQAGRRPNWDKGALKGTIVGGAVGVLLWSIAMATCDDGWLCPEPAGLVTAPLAFGFTGGLVGALIGAMSSREAWWEVPVGRARLGVVPLGRGPTVTASLRF